MQVFGGKQKLSRIQPNRRLERWLGDRARQMESLSLDTEQESSRLAVSLVQALDEAREFHQLEANLQVTQYLTETKEALLAMIRLAGAEDGVLVQLQILSDFRLELLTNLCKDFTVIDGPSRGLLRDCKIFANLSLKLYFSYAWRIIDKFTGLMQEQVKAEPRRVAELRATFLKLAGAMEGAMVRLGEAGSRDLYSVSQYYSRRLVSYIRRVLQVGHATNPCEAFTIMEP